MIVDHDAPLTLIGGGEIGDQDLERARLFGPTVIAADGGARAAVANGITPAAVIGDFDSLDDATRSALRPETLHHFQDQNSTDFDKCLRNVAAPLLLGVGFAGARLDHHLANLNTLVRFPKQKCVLLGEKDITFVAPPSFSLDLAAGTPVSLFPLGAVEGVSDGLKWPIAGLNFAPDGQVGTSNAATGRIDLSFTSPKMLLILPKETFEAAAEALLHTCPGWQ